MVKKKRISKAPEVRREELLEVASRLFIEKGIGDTGVGDITGAADVARGTFYLYFTSKDHVVEELWKRYVAGFMERIDENIDCDHKLVSSICMLTEYALENVHLHKIVYSTADSAAITRCRQSDERIVLLLFRHIQQSLNRRKITDIDAELLASSIFFGVDGALHREIMKDENFDSRAFVAGIRKFVENALGVSVSKSSEEL